MAKTKKKATGDAGAAVEAAAVAVETDAPAIAPVDPIPYMETVMLHPDEIVVDEELNSRDSTGKVEDLAASLQQNQEQPIRVRLVDGLYHLVFGYRRHKAARLINDNDAYDKAKWPDGFKLRAEVCQLDDAGTFAANVAENNQRKDLGVIERAQAMDRMVNYFGWSHEAVAAKFGVSRVTVTRSLKLLAAPRAVRKLVAEGKVNADTVLEILAMPEDKAGEAFEVLVAEIEEGKKASRDSMRQKRRKAKGGQKDEGGSDDDSPAPEKKKPTLKQIRSFWVAIRDEVLPEGAEITQQVVADWVVRHIDGKIGDRAMQSRLAGLAMKGGKK